MNMKAKEKKQRGWIYYCVMTAILMFGGMLLGSVVSGVIAGVLKIPQDKMWIIMSYLPFIGIIALILPVTRFKCRHVFDAFTSKASGNTVKMLLLGLLTGFAMNAVCVLIAFVTGSVRFTGGSLNVLWFLLSFVMVFIQSSAEELLARGYLFLNLRERYGLKTALIIGCLFFALMHGSNTGITVLAVVNLIAISVFYYISVHYLNSMWFAMANHAAWNFTQNLFFGLPNSGLVSDDSVLKLTQSTASIAYDPVFGIEGTITATLVIAVACLIILKTAKKQH